MNLEKVDYRTLKGYKKTKLQSLLEEFIALETPCVKVNCKENEYASSSSAAASLYQAAKKFKMDNIKVKIIEGQVYIFNTLLVEEM